MKKGIFLLFVLFSATLTAQWKPVGDHIKTKWADQVKPDNVLSEYPRPIMERPDWKNLNGLWEYRISPKGSKMPTEFDGNILVPFAVESSLSGVGKKVGASKELWYQTNFVVPKNWKGKEVLLHFGAVDWKADIWLNDIKIGDHSGGYTPFTLNITPFLNGASQKLTVKVWDPTSDGPQPRGKQVTKPDGI